MDFGFQGVTDRVLSEFSQLLNITPEEIPSVGVNIPIPTFDEQTMINLARRAKQSFMSESSFLKLEMPMYVIGDIHGNFFDLLRVLILAGKPPKSRFLFLGDYVDRGQYSVECIALLFALRIKFEDRVFLLRGNHEFANVNANYGFKGECMSIYGNLAAYEAINDAFNWMPLAARIGRSIFAVHGGISPQIASFRQLSLVKRPIVTYDNSIACDLLWSDPTNDTKEYIRSTRGNGVTFGVVAVRDFIKKFKVKHIVRAHQCVPLGVEKFADDMLYTVFTCSNYIDNSSGNRAGLLFIKDGDDIEMFSLPPVTQIPREEAKLSGSHSIIDQTMSTNTLVPFNRNCILSLNSITKPKTYMMKKGIFARAASSDSINESKSAVKNPIKGVPILRPKTELF